MRFFFQMQPKIQIISSVNKEKNILPIAFLGTLFLSFSSQAIPILGPKEESELIKEPQQLTSSKAALKAKRKVFGPTTKDNTLWQIAKSITPEKVSIYQTMGAIYRLNSAAFEKGNIHAIIPKSMLILPTIQEIQKENINEVSRRLKADEKLVKTSSKEIKKPASAQNKLNEINNKEQKQEKDDKNTQPAKDKETENKPPLLNNNNNEIKAEIDTNKIASIIREQMDSTNQDINKLVENNHVLKIKMSEIQDELASVREKLAEGEPLNKEIKQFLDNERLREEEKKNEETGIFRKLLGNAWLLLALAILPALLVVGGIYFFLRWKNKNEQENTSTQELFSEKIDVDEEIQTQAAPITVELEDDDEEIDLNLDIDANDLFAKEMTNQNNFADEDEEIPSSKVNENVQKEIKRDDYTPLNEVAKQAEDYAESQNIATNEIQSAQSESIDEDIALASMLNSDEDVSLESREMTEQKEENAVANSIDENEDFLKDLEFIQKDKSQKNEESFDAFLDEISFDQNESDEQELVQNIEIENQNTDVEIEEVKLEEGVEDKVEESEEFIEPFDEVNTASLSFPRVDEIDLNDLGEFEEDDAFDAALAEQKELEEYALEKQSGENNKLLRSDDEDQFVAGLDMESLLSSDYDDDFSNAKETTNDPFQHMNIEENVEGFEKEFEDLDLAKAFIEMNDTEAALPLLTDLSISENAEVAQEAQKLLLTLKND